MDIIRPGEEPENIKKRLTILFEKLDGAYPDKNIVGLRKDHKKWGETVTDLYRKLGYPDSKSFLEAYGYTYTLISSTGGRPGNNYFELVDQIKALYPNGSNFYSISELENNLPDEFLSKIKSLKNKSNELFGMTLSNYFISIGLLKEKEKVEVVVQKKYNICKVKLFNDSKSYNYLLNINGVSVDDYVLVPIGNNMCVSVGVVEEVNRGVTEDFIENISDLKSISSVISKKDFYANKLKYNLFVNESFKLNDYLNNVNSVLFVEKTIDEDEYFGKVNFACCRGLSFDIFKMVDYLVDKNKTVYSFSDLIKIDEYVFEYYVYFDDVFDILDKFPSIKIVMFLENDNGMVDLLYSESGYDKVTDQYEIGFCDLNSKSRWSLRNSPTNNFKIDNISYEFLFKNDWDSMNYVFVDDNFNLKQMDGEVNE